MGDFFKELEEVDFLDIYDDIAAIPISSDQIIKMCQTMPCKVDLRRCNLVYLVEQKYKDKLSTYKKTKILKWLNKNIPRIFSNPEAKYLKWHESLEEDAKIEWINRKSQALQQFPSPINNTILDCDPNDIPLVDAEFNRANTDSTSNASDTSVTINTVIPTQTQSEELNPAMAALLEVSECSVISETQLTSYSHGVSSSQQIDAGSVGSPLKLLCLKENARLLTIRQSEGFSQESPSFNSECVVTSTQEFGLV